MFKNIFCGVSRLAARGPAGQFIGHQAPFFKGKSILLGFSLEKKGFFL